MVLLGRQLEARQSTKQRASLLKLLDGFNDAILGVGEKAGEENPFMIYDYRKCVEILMTVNNWSEDDAVEWMDYNVICAYFGEDTPVFLYPAELNVIEGSDGEIH